jgi:cilia- and flagella-associated protein 57
MLGVQVYREFSIKHCRSVAFSHGGQNFAAVNGTLLQVYNTHTCDTIATLRGHSGKVSSILWTRDDRRLLSAGKDGAVYEWRMRDFKREKEHVLKGCQYTSIAQTSDNITLLAAGSDCIIKELEEHASAGTQVKQEVETGVVLTSIHLTKVTTSNKALEFYTCTSIFLGFL